MGSQVIKPLKALLQKQNTRFNIRSKIIEILQDLGVSKKELIQSGKSLKSNIDMLFFTSNQETADHVLHEILRLAPERILVVGGGKAFSEMLIQTFQTVTENYELLWNESYSLTWLCRTFEYTRTNKKKVIVLSNYPYETDPPSIKYLENGVTSRTVVMPAGTSLRLLENQDLETSIAIFLVGMFTRSYCENVYISQVEGKENIIGFQVLVNPSSNDLTSKEIQKLQYSKNKKECKRILEEISESLELDPGTSAVAHSGGILME